MKKIIIEIELPTGDVYEIRSKLMPQRLFQYIAQKQVKTIQDNQELVDEIIKGINAEWRICGDEQWNTDKWDSLSPAVLGTWVEKIIEISGKRVQARIKTEKN